MTNILQVKNLRKSFALARNEGIFKKTKKMLAVSDISFSCEEGKTYGIVGESGCGKSTTGRCIMGLEKPDSGEIIFDGKNICEISEKERRELSQQIQLVYQDTLSSLNPKMRIGSSIEEPLICAGVNDVALRRKKVLEMLEKIGLDQSHYFRYPHELSGGQIQRVGIARALINDPKLVVCDEPVSALDVSIQSQILNLLKDLQKEMNLTLLFISHDIGVVRYLSHKVGVMYLGTMVEEADAQELFSHPSHPYTKALLDSVSEVGNKDKTIYSIKGEQPVRTPDFVGCPFYSRCDAKKDICKTSECKLSKVSDEHYSACVLNSSWDD